MIDSRFILIYSWFVGGMQIVMKAAGFWRCDDNRTQNGIVNQALGKLVIPLR